MIWLCWAFLAACEIFRLFAAALRPSSCSCGLSSLELGFSCPAVFGTRPHHFMANRWRKNGNNGRFIFLGSKITVDSDWNHKVKRCLLLVRKAVTNLENILRCWDITLPTEDCTVKADFSSGHGWMWELRHEGGWEPKNWSFWTVLLEKEILKVDFRTALILRLRHSPCLQGSFSLWMWALFCFSQIQFLCQMTQPVLWGSVLGA